MQNGHTIGAGRGFLTLAVAVFDGFHGVLLCDITLLPLAQPTEQPPPVSPR